MTAIVGYTIAADGTGSGTSIVELGALFESLDEARAGLADIPADIIDRLHVRVYEVREVSS
jgi:hypothetical protein